MGRKVFRRIIFTGALLFLGLIICGSRVDARENSLQKGSWALQFEISGVLTTGGKPGTVFNLKHQYTDHSAIRLGVSLDANTSDIDSKTDRAPEANYTDWEKQNTDNENIELIGEYIYYPSPASDLNMFVGFGPHIKYTRQNRNNEYYTSRAEPETASRVIYEYFTDTWTFGGAGGLGCEWFFARQFSLLAEYCLFLDYEHSHENRSESRTPGNDSYTDKLRRDTFYIRPLFARFGLSFYFK